MELKLNKWIYGCVAVLMLAAAWIFTRIDGGEDTVRYEQHLEEPDEAGLGEKPQSDGLVTHLPIISIDTGGETIPGNAILNDSLSIVGTTKTADGKDHIMAHMEVISGEGWHQLSDTPEVSSDITIHIRGNSSRRFDKKNYRIELIKDGNEEEKNSQPLIGMAKSDIWILHGPFLDKTLVRNYVGMNISARVMGYAPNVRFCELELNGEYKGLYLLMENIDVSEGRLNLFQYEEGDPVMSYVVSQDAAERGKEIAGFSFYTRRLEPGVTYNILYPGTKYLTEDVKNYVCQDLSEIEDAIFSWEAENDDDFYVSYLDEDSFVDYFVLQEFLGNLDAGVRSTCFYKDARGKLHIGPVWDYNNVLDNFIRQASFRGFVLTDRGMYSQLIKSERFVKKVIRRYRELRKGILDEDYLISYIRDTQAWLGTAVERNYSVWGYSFEWQNLPRGVRRIPDKGGESTEADVNPDSFDAANAMMIRYLKRRGEWMDEHIDSLLQYCQASKKANTALY